MLRCAQSLYSALSVSSEIGRRPARIWNATYNTTFVMQSRRHIMITAPYCTDGWIADPSVSYSRVAWIESYPSHQIFRLEQSFVVFRNSVGTDAGMSLQGAFWSLFQAFIDSSFLPSSSSSSSSSSSYICHAVGPLVDPFRSHVTRSLFKVLPWFLLPVGQ